MTGANSGSDDRLVLAIDLGTTALKIGVAGLDGRVIWTGHAELETRFGPGGAATQDAEGWWQLAGDAFRQGRASGSFDADSIVAVSCTGQWASTVPVDEAGRPVGECVLWMDSRGAPHARRRFGGPVAGYAPVPLVTWIRRTGGAPSTTGADPIGHMLYLAAERPDVAARTRWYLEPVDYLAMRLTGMAVATHASMTAAWLTDNRHLERLGYDAALVRRAGVDDDKLPPLRPTGALLGTVRADVAAELGIPPDVQVVAGVPDLHSAAVGTGSVQEYQAHTCISTTSWVSCPVAFKKTDVIRQIASVPGLTAGDYLVANNHETAGACLQWLRDRAFAGRLSYDELIGQASQSAAGAGNVVFTPWLAGERSPVDDRYARAGFHNLSLTTTGADLTRAVLEGVAYNARWLHEAVERFCGRRLEPVRMFGGGAVSDLWCQIHADVLGRTIERVVQPITTNLRGAAILAGLALGTVDRANVGDLVPLDRTFEPDERTRDVYDRLFAEFPKLYQAQKGFFGRLNRPPR